MKKILIYLLQEKPFIFVYLIVFIALGIYIPLCKENVTKEFKTISKYSDDEVLIRYNTKDFKIFTNGEYVLHGNLITYEDHGKAAMARSWINSLLILLVLSLILLWNTGYLTKKGIRIYFALQEVHVDVNRDKNDYMNYIYDGKVIYTYPHLLSCSSNLRSALEEYFQNPEKYPDYV